ncbi:MAG: 5'-methylthioadenosine/S-adenosylhomocysteine nucleosidase, partial [Hydrogenophaga sp.]
RHVIPGHGISRFPTDDALSAQLACASQTVLAALTRHLDAQSIAAYGLNQPRLHQGLIVSGDRFVCTTSESAQLVSDLPDALAVEMEGAAFAQVCKDFNIPLAVVRTISDRADDTAHVDFPSFLRDVASKYSGAIIEAMFN